MKKIIIFAICLVIFIFFCVSLTQMNRNNTSDSFVENREVSLQYEITEEVYQFKSVNISYPTLYVNDNPLVEFNNTIKNIVFFGTSEEEIENYPGVFYIASNYEITYFDDQIISLYITVDEAQGMSKGTYHQTGFVYDIESNRQLYLNDFIEQDYLLEMLNTVEVYSDPFLEWLQNESDNDKYSHYMLLSNATFEEGSASTFYLTDDTICLCVSCSIPATRTQKLLIEIVYDWMK